MDEASAPASQPQRLVDRRDFLRLRKGKRHSTRHLLIQMMASPETQSPETRKFAAPRVGFTVTRKTGNAVERNRMKRRLKAAVGNTFPGRAKPGHDYVIIAKRDCLDCGFHRLEEDMQLALDQLHANRAKGARNTPRI